VLGPACHPDDPGIASSGDEDPSSGRYEELGEDPFVLDLAREIPGFGGIFYEEPGSDRMVIARTEDAGGREFSAVRQAVVSRLIADGGALPIEEALRVDFVERVVEYSFIELARHRARLRPHVFAIPGVGSLSVDEVSNRITVGLLDPSAEILVKQLATDLAIPLEMISFVPDSPVELLYGSAEEPYEPSAVPTLLGPISVPDDRLRGGYRVAIEANTSRNEVTNHCTIGFAAYADDSSPRWLEHRPRIVSASHCSAIPFRLDGRIWGEPTVTDTIGRELRDAKPSRDPKCIDNDYYGTTNSPGFKGCVYVDATLVAITFDDVGPIDRDIAVGQIARTDERSDCLNCEASKLIDLGNPTIPIVGVQSASFVNGEFDKVGFRTGWTYGVVLYTCIDRKDDVLKVAILCNDVVHMAADYGDSGSPVFRYNSVSGNARLRGVLWGRGRGSYANWAFVSNLEDVQKELGPLVVLGPPSVDSIVGPTIVGRNARCTWTGYASGSRPISYQWTGVLSGSEWQISGIVANSGYLTLTVTDRVGRFAMDSTSISVDPEAEPGYCGGLL